MRSLSNNGPWESHESILLSHLPSYGLSTQGRQYSLALDDKLSEKKNFEFQTLQKVLSNHSTTFLKNTCNNTHNKEKSIVI